MGWPFGGKKSEDESKPSKTTLPVDESRPATEGASSTTVPPDTTAAATEVSAEAAGELQVPDPAIFEFGGSAAVSGIQMKGICVGDDPEEIQACLWRVDPVDKSTPATEAKYQILF